jgi:hypothetical protein
VHGGGATPAPTGGKVDQAGIDQRQARMRELMTDAHRDDDASRRRYAAAQPELLKLAGEIETLKRGEALTTTPAKVAEKLRPRPTPVAITDYAPLQPAEGETAVHWLGERVWNSLLPTFAAAGVAPSAVAAIAKQFYPIAEIVISGAREELESLREAEHAENAERARRRSGLGRAVVRSQLEAGAGARQSLDAQGAAQRRVAGPGQHGARGRFATRIEPSVHHGDGRHRTAGRRTVVTMARIPNGQVPVEPPPPLSDYERSILELPETDRRQREELRRAREAARLGIELPAASTGR